MNSELYFEIRQSRANSSLQRAARRVFERRVVQSLDEARQKLTKFREHYNHSDRTAPGGSDTCSFRGAAPSRMFYVDGARTPESLDRASECTKTASIEEKRTYTVQNLYTRL